MASNWPTALDNFVTNRQNANPAAGLFQPVDANDINNAFDALNEIEAALGLNPAQGLHPANSFADIVTRLNAIDAPTHKTITPPYTVTLPDLLSILFTNHTAAGAAITLPANATIPLAHGTTLQFSQGSSGTFTIVGATGVTIASRGGAITSAGQYAMVTATKSGTDFWIVSGDIV
jgi:hypothetical protein